ncbi:hypothetical protein SDC9_181026 [bioreactor metagenome]|uniref:Uncharacterized protein n=1 Tax=bioreactor metagenome TaxID=1076179 RepID=A0A645H3D6_9ZZZZ
MFITAFVELIHKPLKLVSSGGSHLLQLCNDGVINARVIQDLEILPPIFLGFSVGFHVVHVFLPANGGVLLKFAPAVRCIANISVNGITGSFEILIMLLSKFIQAYSLLSYGCLNRFSR